MKKMNKIYLIGLFSALIVGWQQLAAQPSISYPVAAQPLTRGLDTSLLTVNVGFASACTGINVAIGLPQGVEYIPGSVATTGGAGGLTVTYTGGTARRPEFSISNAALGNNIVFTLKRIANCGTGASGKDSVFVTSSCGNTSETAGNINSYNILSPSLSLNPPAVTGNANIGSSYSRTFSVTNGGNGCLDTLSLAVVRAGGSVASASIMVGANTIAASSTNGDTSFYKLFGANLPGADNLFCNGESISFTENFTLANCTNLATTFMAYWGRGGNSCQTVSATGIINMATGVPNLTAVLSAPAVNNCGTLPHPVTLTVTNTGTTPASNINITFGDGTQNFIPSFAYYLDTAAIMVSAPSLTSYHPTGINVAGRVLAAYSNGGVPLCADGKVGMVDFNMPAGYILAAGQSITVTYSVLTCAAGQCNDNTDAGNMSAGLNYKDQCGGSSYALPLGVVNISPGSVVKINTANAQFPAQALAGTCFNYKVDMQLLKSTTPATPNGYIEYAVILPAGVTLNTASETGSNLPAQAGYPMMIGNKAVFRHNIIHQPSWLSTHTVTFNFCVAPGSCGTLPISSEVSVSRDSTCTQAVVSKKCSTGSIELLCGNTCNTGGVAPVSWAYYRTSYGFPDNDNNGLADVSGSIDLTKIDRDRYRPGDILHSEYRSYILNQTTPATINNWNYVYSEWNFNNGKFVPSGTATVTIKRGATTYTLNGVAITTVTAGTNFKADWSTHPGLPGGFTYQLGDSVLIQADFSVNGNYSVLGSNAQVNGPGFTNDAPGIVQLTHNVYASQTANPPAGPINGPDRFSCFSPKYNANIIGLSHFIAYDGVNPNGATGCNNFDIVSNTYTRVLNAYNSGRYFTYEYRPEALPDTIILDIPAGWDYIAQNQVTLLYTNEPSSFTTEVLNITPATSSYLGGTRLIYNFKTLIQNGTIPHWGTDGMMLSISNKVRANCSTPATATLTVTEYAHWNDYTSAATPVPYTLTATRALNYNIVSRPAIAIQNNTGTVQGILPQHYWDVQINSIGSNNAPYIWMALEQGASGISIDSVVLKPSNVVLAPNMYNGTRKWYQVSAAGIASGNNQQARVYFKYSNCTTDSIKFLSGWNCSSYPAPDPSASTCTEISTYLKVQPQPSQVQLGISRQPAAPSITLCTVDTIEAVVNSALGANLGNPVLTIIPPVGLTVTVPIYVEYPLGSGTWQGITPTINAGNYVINLGQHSGIGINGLPGTISNPLAPGRQVRIRVPYNTSCSFVSGSRIGFIATGQYPCGTAAIGSGDQVNSNQINITGATTTGTAGMLIDVNPPELTCGNTETVPFNVTPVTVGTQPGDTAVYTLPAGIAYVPSSFTPGLNCAGCTLIQSAGTGGSTVLKVALPAGVPPGTAIEYTMNLKASATGSCGNVLITGEAQRQIGGLVCGGSTCPSSKIVIGSASQSVLVKKPQLNVTNVLLNMSGNSANYTVTVSNSGTENAMGGFPVHLLCGSATGILLHSFNTTAIAPGGTQTFTGSFTWTPSASCPAGSLLFAKVSDTTATGEPVCMCSAPQGVASTTPLPVDLVTFNGEAKGCKAVLNWQTALENNFSHFELQRSNNGKDFSTLATLEGKGNNSSYTIAVEHSGKGYFRLLLVDNDGSATYSKMITVSSECQGNITVIPNPANDKISISGFNGKASIRFINTLGQVVKENTDVAPGQIIYTGHLSKGLYTVQVVSEGHVLANVKLVKY